MENIENDIYINIEAPEILITKKQTDDYIKQKGLRRVLTPMFLWGIGVGTVISGQYSGWNYGLSVAGTSGFIITTAIVTVAFMLFVFLFARLSRFFPFAGGPYAYARKGLGTAGGFFAGISTAMEFLFASSVITLSIGSYLRFVFPGAPARIFALAAFIMLILIDITGIKVSSILQITITLLSISGTILFLMGVTGEVRLENIFAGPILPFGIKGVLSALPFAIWFYICIEGISLTAEETQNPSRNIPVSFYFIFGTLAVIYFLILFVMAGTVQWKELNNLDYPLSYILQKAQQGDVVLLFVFTSLTLFGLLASLHGIINGYSRQIYALSRAGYLPRFLSKLSKGTKTPYFSILLPGVFAMLFIQLFTIKLLVTLSALNGLVMYILVIISFLRISYSTDAYKKEIRSSKLAYTALVFAVAFLITYAILDIKSFCILIGQYVIFALYFYSIASQYIISDAPEEAEFANEEIKKLIKA